MTTVKTYKPEVRDPPRAPKPNRKPARLSSEVAHFRGRSQRKAKSR